MKLILLGPPGSGKGTVSEKLAKDFGLVHISPGEMLREEVSKKTSLGEEIKRYVSEGQLVPDGVVTDIVKLKIRNHPDFLLDGFPRNLEQARILEGFVKADLVVFLEVSEKTAVERISGRRTCTKCGAVYHVKYIIPKKRGICDKCGGKLGRRTDERAEVVKERFRVYQQQSLPLVGFYGGKGILRRVEGGGTPEEVYERVKEIVKKIS